MITPFCPVRYRGWALVGLVALSSLLTTESRAQINDTPSASLTISSDPKAPYYRTIDVLNSMAAAEIGNVTFTVDDGF